MVAYAYNPSTQEAEAGWPGLQSKEKKVKTLTQVPTWVATWFQTVRNSCLFHIFSQKASSIETNGNHTKTSESPRCDTVYHDFRATTADNLEDILPTSVLSEDKPGVYCQGLAGNFVFGHFKGHMAPQNAMGVPY
jgi:hypothetical protein